MKLDNLTVVTPRLRAQWEAYAEDKRGATAVEFAMIAGPFFFLIFGLIEVSIIFIMSTIVEHGLQEASRDIRTGQIQNGGGEAAFRAKVCASVSSLINCDGKLHIDVKRFGSNFSSASMGSPIDENDELDTGSFSFDPGSANEVVSVRIFYEWDLITPIMTQPLVNLNGNKHLIQANTVFRNEPF